MAGVRRLQPVIQERVDLLERLKGLRDIGEVLMASWAFAAFINGEPGLERTSWRRRDLQNRYCDDVLLWTL
jgi:hypothetical protein